MAIKLRARLAYDDLSLLHDVRDKILLNQEVISITHLTFDCYGTLIDWRKGIETHLGRVLQEKGLSDVTQVYSTYVRLEAMEEGTYKKYNEIIANTALRVARHFGLELKPNEAIEFAESVPSWTPFHDTVQTLRKLGKFGLKRIILSNIDSDTLRESIRINDLDVDGFVTAEEIGSYKPSLGHWTSFLERYRIKKSNVLHVAQSVFHDIIPARNLGLLTAWINRYDDAKRLEVKPTFEFHTLAELGSLFG